MRTIDFYLGFRAMPSRKDPSTWPQGIRPIVIYRDGRKYTFKPHVLLHPNELDCIVELRGGVPQLPPVDFSVRSSIGLAHALSLAENEIKKQLAAKLD